MTFAFALLIIILSGILRRCTGGYPAGKLKNVRTACKFLYGCLLCYIITGFHWLIPLVGVALWLGEKPGLGHWRGMMVRYRAGLPLESTGEPEWYQYGWLANPDIKAAYASAAVRGLIYGSLCIPLAFFHWQLIFIPLAMMIAVPLSGLLAQWMPATKFLEMGDPNNSWAWDELIEGLLVGLLCYMFLAVI